MQKWHCAQWQLAKESFTYIPVPAATYAITKHIHDTTNRRTNDSWCIAKVPIPVNSGLLFVVECHSIVSTVTSCSQTKFAALDFHFFTIVRNPQNVSICFVTPCSIISLANIHFLCVIPGYLELAWCLVHCSMICCFALWIKTVVSKFKHFQKMMFNNGGCSKNATDFSSWARFLPPSAE